MRLRGRRGDGLRSGEMQSSHDTHTLGQRTTNFAGDIMSGLMMMGLLNRAPNKCCYRSRVREIINVGLSVDGCTTAPVYSAAIHAARNRGAREQTLAAKRLELYW